MQWPFQSDGEDSTTATLTLAAAPVVQEHGGSGGAGQFGRVRSGVKEGLGWAAVTLCTQALTVEAVAAAADELVPLIMAEVTGSWAVSSPACMCCRVRCAFCCLPFVPARSVLPPATWPASMAKIFAPHTDARLWRQDNVIVAGFLTDALARLAVRQPGAASGLIRAAVEAAVVAGHGWRSEEGLRRAMGKEWWQAVAAGGAAN